MQKVYYKVVTRRMNSAMLMFLLHVGITYKLGEWVKPKIKGSALFVFSTRKSAESWRANWGGKRIFKCLVKRPRKSKRMSAIVTPTRVHNFWRKLAGHETSTLPKTVLCSSVKLIEEVA